MDTQAQPSTIPSAASSIADRHPSKGDVASREVLECLLQRSHDLPLPGAGHTLIRWRHLAAVAAIDLTCAKLFESHADAIAILHELAQQHLIDDDALWAVWCAEPPTHKVDIMAHTSDADVVYIHGVKAWCSGADAVAHALISCWNPAGEQCLVAVQMDQPAVAVTSDGWHAVGMGPTNSVDVRFDHAVGIPVGTAGSYVNRPGFMHGGAGVAACWYGAAGAIAQYVVDHAKRRPDDAHALAHLGAMDVALKQAACLLSHAASEIDALPSDSCASAVRRARLAVESAVETVLHRAPRALGAGPLCKNAHLARLLTDLPVFLRQSHAEHDLAAHARALIDEKESPQWTL